MLITLSKELKPNQTALHIKGDKACFTVPSSGYHNFSYAIPTGSAAKGMFDCVYAHPHDRWDAEGNPVYRQLFKWVIDKIFILKPIKYESFGKLGRMQIQPKNQKNVYIPQMHTILIDVEYVFVGHPHIIHKRKDTTPRTYIEQFERRCKNKKAYYPPFLGCAQYNARYGFPPEKFETEDINMVINGYLKAMHYNDEFTISSSAPEPEFIPMLTIKNGIAIINE